MSLSISNKKILIIGASSSIGKSIFKYDKKKKFIGTYFKNKRKNLIKFDPSNEKISAKFNLNKISMVVLLQGIAKNEDCVKDKIKSNFVNIELNKYMIKDLVANDIPFIFFSTEWVYPGNRKLNSEKSPVSPVNLYANQKLKIEQYIKNNAYKYYILRLAKTYTNVLDDNSFLNNWNKMIKKKIFEFKCYKDQFFSPVFSKDIYEFILFVEKKNFYGLYNFGGSERFSRIACLKAFLKLKNIKKFSLIEQKIPRKVPQDVSMNINKLKKIKFRTSKFRNNISKLY